MLKIRVFLESLLFFVIAVLVNRLSFYVYSYLVYRYALGADLEGTYQMTLEEQTLDYVNSTEIIYVLGGWLITFGIILMILNLTHHPFLDFTGHGLKFVNVVLSVILGIALVLLTEGMAHANGLIFNNTYNAESVYYFNSMLWTFLIVGLIIPLVEEFFYRGLLLNRLSALNTPFLAILMQGILFSVSHFSILQGLYVLALGMVTGYAVYKTKSVISGMIIHIIFNMTGLYMQNYVQMDYFLGQLLLLIVLGILLILFGLYQMRPARIQKKEQIIHINFR